MAISSILMMFQFTQPKRAATNLSSNILFLRCFNSRSPSGLRPCQEIAYTRSSAVSIHAAQAGCDRSTLFQLEQMAVSIHAAQAGCDNTTFVQINTRHRFNSRSPSGLRHRRQYHNHNLVEFQFTQPKRAATVARQDFFTQNWFQFTQPKRAATTTA